ncbi:MAG: diacylglycerol kinase [Deltaproteobacteria bacterium]|nr:diacylglycerol kinase [Deltaproteobacteria bacterium]
MEEQKRVTKPKNWFESLNYAIEGVIYAFKTQRHIRYHYVIAAAALFLSLFLELPVIEFVMFTFSIVILLFAEMMNTAIEEAVNLIEDKHHILAKNAKDVSAGAVLISSIGVGIMVYMLFSKYLYEPMGLALREARVFSGHIAVIALLLVLIAVVTFKATIGKGSPLHGGMPSGHSAVAFSLFTSISLLTLEPLVVILSFILAVMVSHSRLIGGIHTKLEVILGGLLGCGLTLLVFRIFFMTIR